MRKSSHYLSLDGHFCLQEKFNIHIYSISKMKTESINNIIFVVSLVVFVLQITGYLAPAWFVKEVAYLPDSRGMRADGRRFHLPYLRDSVDGTMAGAYQGGDNRDENMDDSRRCSENTSSGRPGNETPEPEPATPPNGNQNAKDGTGDPPSLRPGKPPKDHSSSTTTGRPNLPTDGHVSPSPNRRHDEKPGRAPSDEPKNDPTGGTENGRPSGQPNDRQRRSINIDKDDAQSNPTSKIMAVFNREQFLVTKLPPKSTGEHTAEQHKETMQRRPLLTNVQNEANENVGAEKRTNVARQPDGTHLLYLTAGFWYSRACVTTRDPDADDKTGMQWCTVYTRLDNRTLEEKKNMFELRLEATLGVVLCALSLFISSTACRGHRHHGKSAIASLATLFISGAVMTIPVVHVILQHVQIHNKVLRTRNWKHLTKGLHVQHDLFDHYSVILCGAASVISVLLAVILTLVSCRSSSKSDSWYNLKPVEEGEKKHELPVHWVHNSKITVPHVLEIKDEIRDDSESGYSEVKEDCTTSGNDTGNEEDRIEFDTDEIKTFDM